MEHDAEAEPECGVRPGQRGQAEARLVDGRGEAGPRPRGGRPRPDARPPGAAAARKQAGIASGIASPGLARPPGLCMGANRSEERQS